MLQFMCGREDTQVPRKDQYFIQISWAGGKGCSGNQNTDAESTTGRMCASVEGGDGMKSRACDSTSTKQLFRVETLPDAKFRGKKNAKNQVGVYR
eukprot:COSAG05_NODE_565_length_8643_cov_5.314373_2_plen_95_part_00